MSTVVSRVAELSDAMCLADDRILLSDAALREDAPAVKLVVNIATAGRPELLRRTLRSLSQCDLPPGYEETVIVENGPRQQLLDIIRSAPKSLRLRYMHVPCGNKSAALNASLETLNDCLVFYTDDDVRFDRAVLCQYSDIAARLGAGAFFGGPIDVDYDAPPPEWLRQYLPCSAKGWKLDGTHRRIGHSTERFIGCNWAAWSQDIRAAGGFNPSRGPGSPSGSTGQETDMQDRLLQLGLTGIYVPGAHVWHYVPQNRCSPEWVIQRSYRHGIEDGARAVGDSHHPLPPFWISYRYIKGVMRACMWSFSSDPILRFKARARRSYDQGLMLGALKQMDLAKSSHQTAPRKKAA